MSKLTVAEELQHANRIREATEAADRMALDQIRLREEAIDGDSWTYAREETRVGGYPAHPLRYALAMLISPDRVENYGCTIPAGVYYRHFMTGSLTPDQAHKALSGVRGFDDRTIYRVCMSKISVTYAFKPQDDGDDID